MKQLFALLLVGCVLFALLLAACGSESPTDPTQAPTQAPTEKPTEKPTEEPTQAPTDAPTEEPTQEQAKPLTLEEELQALFGQLGSWYNMALRSEYDQPKYVNLRNLFYNGFKDEPQTPTDAEWAELKNVPGFDINFDMQRLPVAKINAVLKQYFGITLANIKNPNFGAGFVYLKSTDCYYSMHTDAECLDNFRVIVAEEQHDGTIRMTYTADDGAYIYVAVLKPVDGGYQILSNQKNVK